MNLNTLFPKQKQLDEYIVKEKELEGIDLLQKKTVALICELYECVNEARFFKYWSEDTKPRTSEKCYTCNGLGEYYDPIFEEKGECPICFGIGNAGNPLLEEFVDTIHFVLSIANDLGVHEHEYIKTQPRDLNELVIGTTNLATIIPMSRSKEHVQTLINNIIAFGYQLGFDEKTVVEAYDKKNAENYKRQNSNY